MPSSFRTVQRRTSPQPRTFRFRAFYLTVLCIAILAVLSLVADQTVRYKAGSNYGVAQRRALEELDVSRLVKRDLECRLVHHAQDKCAFIKANCPDEEAGLLSYLSLYYCALPRAQPVAFIILSLWLALLFTTIGIAASDFFSINLSTIASILGMSESMAGVTFLAFGNGSPDVFSTFAAMASHSGSLAVGELIGAAGFITAVVAGSMALVREFKVGKKTFVRDVGFFIVAASFSMVFLADGSLQLWECCLMVGFYLFYVVFVVGWHWYLGLRRKRREREAAARGHYLAMAHEDTGVTTEEEYDEDAPAGERRYTDAENFDALERGSSPAPDVYADEESDEDGDSGKQLAAEMARSMRVTRPRGIRRNTLTPIRPSLLGALEFRSVLSTLQKARSSNSHPIHLRRYSDDPQAILTRSDGSASASEADIKNTSNSAANTADSSLGVPSRARAVSMNDAAVAKPKDPAAFSVAQIPNIGVLAATPLIITEADNDSESNTHGLHAPPSPTISLSPPPSAFGSPDPISVNSHHTQQQDALVPPNGDMLKRRYLEVASGHGHDRGTSKGSTPGTGARSALRPRLQIPGTSSRDSSNSRVSPVLRYSDYTESPVPMSSRSSRAPSLSLPDAADTSESDLTDNGRANDERQIQWWPYKYLPSPYTLASTLFPTLCTFREKPVWDKFVSLVSAPSIFLLAITLPVVESESDEKGSNLEEEVVEEVLSRSRRGTGPMLPPDSPLSQLEPEWLHYRRSTNDSYGHSARSSVHEGIRSHHDTAAAFSAEGYRHLTHPAPIPSGGASAGQAENVSNMARSPDIQDWNRWLVSLQIFTAPIFVVFIVWANNADGDIRLFVNMLLYSLLGSLIAFAILLLTTSPQRPPKYRFLLCFLGFVVAIAWISTIANEVVGVLKAIGVILGISDAILGLTIFAVGNSLGDLVADITVARLGYPVMALSACIGGPMLNILLGIGLGGIYMTLTEADRKHSKHPNKQIKYKPYRIEVSGTLMISAVTLLVTLVGLLIAVPMNKWVMSRRIGWSLIALWATSTIVNLAVEVSGVWDDSHTSIVG